MTVLEHAQLEAKLDEHDRILKGEGNRVGLIADVQDLKDWRLEQRTERRVLTMVLTAVLSIGSATVAFAITNLKDAVLSRPVVIATGAPPQVKP